MHTPVLLQEVVNSLVTDSSGFYVDATFGRGGHTRVVLDKLDSRARLLALDRDPEAVACARAAFGSDKRVIVEQASFDQLARLLEQHGMSGRVSGVLLDLGVSSPQLDDPARGFSFLHDGPLDMRMDPAHGMSAADWIACAKVQDIEQVLREFGEERFARRIAAAIVRERAEQAITSTDRLAQIVARAHPAWEKSKHPATRSFQAIRIFINGELDALISVLEQAMTALMPAGRLVVISFHSLEDRIVKRFMRDRSRVASAPGLPLSHQAQLRRIGKSIRAGECELQANPRSRSAIMRVAEKLSPGSGVVHG